jgi:uncharacterized integral membrane protein
MSEIIYINDVVGFDETIESKIVEAEAKEVIENQIVIYPLPVKDYVQEKIICSKRMYYVMIISGFLSLIIIVIILINNPSLTL